MKIIRDSDKDVIEASVCTVGAFDGVHVGHQTVINEVKRRADARDVASAVVTFDVHPALVVRPESAPRLLTRFCLLYTSPSPRDATLSRMPSSA